MSTPSTNTKQELLKSLFTSFTTGIRARKSIEPRTWLEKRELNPNDLQIGFNSGQFHHRKSDEFRKGYVDIGVLKESDAPVKEEGMKAYTCFGHYGIVFPLKDEQGEIVNLFAIRIKVKNETPLYLNRDGLYPCYPNQFTKRLFITETIMDAASLLQSKVMERGDEVLALFEGELRPQHVEAVKKLKQLEQVIFIGNEVQELKKQFPYLNISTIKLPDGHTMNDMLVNYGAEGICKLLEEVCQANVTETKVNINEMSIQDINANDANKKKLSIYNAQKIGYNGEAGNYYALGTLPHDLGTMNVVLEFEDRHTKKRERDKLDLYNNVQVQNYCTTQSEKNGSNANQLEADIMDFTNLLSEHRDKLIEKSQSAININQPAAKINHLKEREAVEFLSQPKLIKNINRLIGLSGIIGEENNRILLFICATTYKTNPLHVLVQSSSGSGKSHLINSIKDLMPSEDITDMTRITSKALYYCQDNDLTNKIIVIQDIDGLDKDAQYAFREAQSSGFLKSRSVSKDKFGNLIAVETKVTAHFSSMVATTKEEVYFDNMSRSVIVGIDESEAQTYRIVNLQNERIAGLVNTETEQRAKELLQNCIRVLRPCKIINRYANKIKLPVEAKMLRRLNEQFQNFIMQVTYLHQYQREIDDKGRVVCTPEDIKMAVDLFFDSIWMKVDELDGTTRQFFERMKTYLKKRGTNKMFTQKEIRQALNVSKSQCFRNLETLLRMEYIAIVSGSANRGYQYKITEWKQVKEHKDRIKQELYAQLNALRTN